MNPIYIVLRYTKILFLQFFQKFFMKLLGQNFKSTAMSVYIPPISRLSMRVVRVLGCNPSVMTLQGTNTYIIGTGSKRILLDTGEKNMSEYVQNFKNFLKSENIALEHIIISHWHKDHIGGLDDILSVINDSNCCVWKYRRTDKKEDFYENGKIKALRNGQELKVEGATVRLLHTPGHTTDHAILHLLEENAIFSADCILGEGSTVFENLSDYMDSLYKIKDLNPSRIYPGHGPEITNNTMARIQLYIDHRIKRENEILALLNESQDKIGFTAADIVEKLYKNTPKLLLIPALYNVKQHLKKLQTESKVNLIEEHWIRSRL